MSKATILVASIACLAPAVAQDTFHVDQAATGAATGLTWDDAFVNMHQAFAVLEAGDVVKVAQGTYTPDIGGIYLPGNRNAYWQFAGGTVEGGYRGLTAPSVGERDDRSSTLYPTVFSGEINDPGDDTDNSHRLLWSQTSQESIFDGIAFTDTYQSAVNMTAPHAGYGGAVSLLFGDVHSFNDCTFSNNYMFNDLAIYRGGPGLFIFEGSGAITNCQFLNNHLDSDGITNTVGGSLYLFEANIDITDTVFDGNQNLTTDGTASNWGGAVYLEAGYQTFTRCQFRNNRADGWVFANGGCVMGWVNSSRVGNSSYIDCTFENNFAQQGSCLWLWDSRSTQEMRQVRSCEFRNNDAAGSNGGVIFTQPGLPLEIHNSLFVHNTIDTIGNPNNIGGSGVVHIVNSTLTRDDPGASVRVSDLTIDNSIVRGTAFGNQVPVGGSQFSPVTIRNSNISDLASMPTDMLTTVNTIDQDPDFADAAGGNYRLLPGSPSIDTGDDALVPAGLTTDLGGFMRIGGVAVDMGAYESCLADWNANGLVNTSDFLAFLNDYNAARVGGTPVFGDPDLAPPQGVINTADMLAFLNLFNVGC